MILPVDIDYHYFTLIVFRCDDPVICAAVAMARSV